jgi:hypothetical protein
LLKLIEQIFRKVQSLARLYCLSDSFEFGPAVKMVSKEQMSPLHGLTVLDLRLPPGPAASLLREVHAAVEGVESC